MSNSALASYTKLSPNKNSPRNHTIDTITIHCTAGSKNNTAKQIADQFSTVDRGASCNYAVGGDGSIALVVDEKDRSWCTSSGENDHRAVTIEVASNVPGTEVSDTAYSALLDLVTDICKRNGIKKLVWSTNKADRVGHLNGCNMTVHRDYANKACPGEWLYSRHGQIAEEVNKRLEEKEDEDMTPEKLAEMLPEAFALLAKKEAAPWAKEALDYCKEKGYMVGDGSGNQQPMKPLLRQEAAQIIMNIAGDKL